MRKSNIIKDEHIAGNIDLFVYPNPANDLINCLFNQGDLIEIIDLAGRIVLSKQIPKNCLTLSIDISVLNSGSYVLMLKSDKLILKENKLNVVR